MSASEKLKALDGAMHQNETVDDMLVRQEARLAYRNALPQIVAVVEAAEKFSASTNGRRQKEIRASLSALEEALS